MDRLENWATVRHFRLVIALCEHGTLLHAAHSLNLAQPTASKLLQDLEGSIGAQLFARTRRGVVPTELGKAFASHCRMMLSQLNQVSEAIDAMGKGQVGRVVVGSLLTGSSYLLPAAIANVWTRAPTIRVKIVEGVNSELLPRLFSGEVDFLIGRLTDISTTAPVIQESLFSEDAFLVGRRGHPLGLDQSVTLETLARQRWMLPPPGTTMRDQFEQIFRDGGVLPPPAAVETTSFITSLWLLRRSDVLGILPRSVLEDPAYARELQTIAAAKRLVLARIGISRLAGVELNPAAKILVEELRRIMTDQMTEPHLIEEQV
ncbi:MAG TPA: LysR family transcriptional regulator [Sphingobium sp.]|nr:LysR family transcriptional regulator [Sphingobium sp.]